MARKVCRVGGRGCKSFLRYLEETIIPDTVESRGADSPMVADLRACAKFIRGASSVTVSGSRFTPQSFKDYLNDTLIPDLDPDSGYVTDFEEAQDYF